jgi:hypothetical protein
MFFPLLFLAGVLQAAVPATPAMDGKNHDAEAPRLVSKAIREADYVEVVSSFGKTELRTRIESKERLAQLATILGRARYESRPLTWHGTRQRMEVYGKGVGEISIASDGEKLRCFGAGLSGEYYVDSSICDAVLQWANQTSEP